MKSEVDRGGEAEDAEREREEAHAQLRLSFRSTTIFIFTTTEMTMAPAMASSSSSAQSSSSSATPAPLDLIQPQLAHLISLYPFTSVPSNTLPLLSEITHHYLQLITRLAANNAHHAGRTTLAVWDIMAALAEVGSTGVDDLVAGWMAPETATSMPMMVGSSSGAEQGAVVRKDWQERIENGWKSEEARRQYEQRRSAVRERTRCGWSDEPPVAEMRLMRLTKEEAELYDELRILEEERLPAVKRRRTSDGVEVDAYDDEDEEEDVVASLDAQGEGVVNGRDLPAYIPSFLPPLPSQSHDAALRGPPKEDRMEGVERGGEVNGEPQPQPSPGAGVNGRGEDTSASALPAPEAGQEQAASSSYLTPPVAFASSAMYANATGAGLDGEPAINGGAPGSQLPDVATVASSLPSLPPPTDMAPTSTRTSTPALLTALTSLATSGETPSYLPKLSTASANKTRRRLASLVTQPGRYEPLDVLYSSLPSRPSCLPFLPAPSHLVTLAAGGVPRFTPTRPRGRPLSLGSVAGELGGASHPALAYRQPRMAADVARYLLSTAPGVPQQHGPVEGAVAAGANGINGSNADGSAPLPIDPAAAAATASTNADGESTLVPSTLYRCLHVYDPAPLRDSVHVERVFRGRATRGSGDGGSEAWLKGAHDALRVATGVPGAVAEAGAKKGGAQAPPGTVVYTWDWMQRDPVDGALLPPASGPTEAQPGPSAGTPTTPAAMRGTAVGR